MIVFTIFDATGAVNRTVSCPMEMIVHQLQPGESYLDGVYDHDAYYLDTASGTLQRKPPRPAGDMTFDYAGKTWGPTIYTDAQRIDAALHQRARLLAACDWSQLPDVPAATQALWRAYRQALRDITAQAGYPQQIDWPTEPV